MLQLMVNEHADYISEVFLTESMRKYTCPLSFKVTDDSNVNETQGIRYTTPI